jgi:3-dehydroquinate synthase
MSGAEDALAPHPITVARGSLDTVGQVVSRVAPAHLYYLVTDSVVNGLHRERVQLSFRGSRVAAYVFDAGEEHKTRETWALVTDAMLEAGVGRDTTIVALGGGVVGDLAGFVAATYMRGIPFVQVPTTLLAMIDASIGGKTGVDTPAGKNLVGAFHQPSAVIADPEVLATLPPAQLRSGLAEAIKHGVIADTAYFGRIVDHLPALLSANGASTDEMTQLIVDSVRIKTSIVQRDERESGLRKILNFGHTIGHAIEQASGFRLLHGQAVAIGMAVECALGERLGVTDPGTGAVLTRALIAAGLPTRRPADLHPDRIVAATRSDKKSRHGAVEYALPSRIGAMAAEAQGWTLPVADDLVLDVLA